MKRTILFLALMAGLLQACDRSSDLPEPVQGKPSPTLRTNGTVPTHTWAEFNDLILETRNEVAFYEKVAMVAHGLTEFVGQYGNFSDGSSFALQMPCDIGLEDPGGGMFRVLSDKTGFPVSFVKAKVSCFIMPCISDQENVPTGDELLLLDRILNSLDHFGTSYELYTRIPAQPTSNPPDVVSIAYGIYRDQSGDVANVYEYNLSSGITSHHASKPLGQVESNQAVWIEPRPVGGDPLYINDPCHYLYNGSGTGGGGSSGHGGGNLTDDGYEKGYIPGPISNPPDGYDSLQCWTFVDGLRVAEMHLATRKEGGLFSGKSEVYVSATFYSSTDPDNTYETNANGPERTVTISGAQYTYRDGKLLVEVKPSDISNSTNIRITPSTGMNWDLIDNGFCGDPYVGFDRVFLTFWEYDKSFWKKPVPYNHLPIPNMAIEDYHFCELTTTGDRWYQNQSSGIDRMAFANNNGYLYLVEQPQGGYAILTSEPNADYTWFKLEVF